MESIYYFFYHKFGKRHPATKDADTNVFIHVIESRIEHYCFNLGSKTLPWGDYPGDLKIISLNRVGWKVENFVNILRRKQEGNKKGAIDELRDIAKGVFMYNRPLRYTRPSR